MSDTTLGMLRAVTPTTHARRLIGRCIAEIDRLRAEVASFEQAEKEWAKAYSLAVGDLNEQIAALEADAALGRMVRRMPSPSALVRDIEGVWRFAAGTALLSSGNQSVGYNLGDCLKAAGLGDKEGESDG